MPLYFAYGSNMDLAAMRVRCPRSRAVGPARLIGHRLFITRDGYASVTREPGRLVWGLLWDLALTDVPALDRYESLGTGLYAKVIRPVVTDRGPRRAIVYMGRSREAGLPKPGYVEGIIAAASQAGLPDIYLRELQAGLPTGSSERTSALSKR
jgi:AIG2-like family